jgi:hypothetical protein
MSDDAGFGVPAPPARHPRLFRLPHEAHLPEAAVPPVRSRRAVARYVLALLAVVAAVSGGVSALPTTSGRPAAGSKLTAQSGAPLAGPAAARPAAGTVVQRSSRGTGCPAEFVGGHRSHLAAGPEPTGSALTRNATSVDEPGLAGRVSAVRETPVQKRRWARPAGRGPPAPGCAA